MRIISVLALSTGLILGGSSALADQSEAETILAPMMAVTEADGPLEQRTLIREALSTMRDMDVSPHCLDMWAINYVFVAGADAAWATFDDDKVSAVIEVLNTFEPGEAASACVAG